MSPTATSKGWPGRVNTRVTIKLVVLPSALLDWSAIMSWRVLRSSIFGVMVQLRPLPSSRWVSRRLVSSSSPRFLAFAGAEIAGLEFVTTGLGPGACCFAVVEVDVFEQLNGHSPQRLMAAMTAMRDTPMPDGQQLAGRLRRDGAKPGWQTP